MSHNQLKYCCPNPECHHMFTVDEAKHEESIIQFSTLEHSRYHSLSLAVVHVLCPKCNTIVDSLHVPVDAM